MNLVKEYTLGNTWRVTYEPQNFDGEGKPYAVKFTVERKNGNKFEPELQGQLKIDGCCDIGLNQPVMLHFCDVNDTILLKVIFDDGMFYLNSLGAEEV